MKRASATCDPESESQKKVALDTEQNRHHAPPSHSEGQARDPAPDANTSDVTKGTDQNSHRV